MLFIEGNVFVNSKSLADGSAKIVFTFRFAGCNSCTKRDRNVKFSVQLIVKTIGYIVLGCVAFICQ
jgi:hypothetical protein